MRTKTLILMAAVAAAGVATSMAQVYSVNAVGYINLSLKKGFNMVANQLNNAGNKLSEILPNVDEDTTVYKYDAAAQKFQDSNTFITGAGWFPDNTLAPGEGAFIQAPADKSVTLVGEVPQGDALNVSLVKGFQIVSSIVPISGSLDDTTANSGMFFPGGEDDALYFFDPTTQKYKDSYTFFGGGVGWFPEKPTPAVGEAFWVLKAAPGTWTRKFSVNTP